MSSTYKPTETQRSFMLNEAYVRVLAGPVGCLAPETLVVTEHGLIPIAHIDRPMRVLSWNEKTGQLQLSWCGGSFPKGTDYLYRVTTPQGEFAANEHHLVRGGPHAYRPVKSLALGQSVTQYCGDQPLKSLVQYLLSSQSDAPNSRETAEGSLASYARSARQCGQRLLREEGIDLEFAQEQSDAQSAALRNEGGANSFTNSSNLTYVSDGAILNIEREKVKRSFWDMQVLDTNNYVTADGTIHHNSGKSVTCIHELVRLACGQAPNAKGVRKTRAIIVRNTADQLALTTRKTVFDWLPPGEAGIWKAVEKTFILMAKLPDGTQVESEWIFIPLDTPDDVRKALSLETTFLWGNESRELNSEVVDGLLSRLNRYPSAKDGGPTRSCALFDTNMPDEDTWWHDKMESPPSNWNIHKQPPAILTADAYLAKFGEEPEEMFLGKDETEWSVNPECDNYDHLPKQYYPNIIPGKTEDWLRVYLRSEYGRSLSGTPVYEKTFTYDFHVAKESIKPIKSQEYPVTIGLDFGRCYDDKTEVLTEAGWKFFVDVSDTERVATMHPETRELSYTHINFKTEFDYAGDMLTWQGTNINLCVTPEHRFPYTRRDSPDVLRWASAQEVSEGMSSHLYAVVAPRAWVGVMPVDLPLGLSALSYARLLGWWVSNGGVCASTNRVHISQSKPAPELELVRQDLIACGVTTHPVKTGFTFSNKTLASHFREFGLKHDGVRRVPDSIRMAPREVIEAFVMAYTAGDGHIRPARRAAGAEEHTIWFQSIDLAGQFQDMAQKLGWGSGLRKQKAAVSYMRDGRKIVGCSGWVVQFKKIWERVELRAGQFSRSHYEGKIYCLNVPYHTLCVRRNGKVSWNGNTPAAVFMQRDPRGRVVVLAELNSDNMGIETFLRTKLNPFIANNLQGCSFIVAPDPAGYAKQQQGEMSLVDVVKQAGFKCQRPPTNDPEKRIQAVERLLVQQLEGKAMFIIDPGCIMLIKGFRYGYRYKIKKNGEMEDKPDKNSFSHGADACQYGASIIDMNIRGATLNSGRREIKKSGYSYS